MDGKIKIKKVFCLNLFYLASWLETGKASIPQIIFNFSDLCVKILFRISLQDPNYRPETIVYRRTTTTDPYHNSTEQFLWLCSCVAYHHWCCEFKSPSGRGVQHYVIQFVSDLRQVGGFLRVFRFPPLIKLTATI